MYGMNPPRNDNTAMGNASGRPSRTMIDEAGDRVEPAKDTGRDHVAAEDRHRRVPAMRISRRRQSLSLAVAQSHARRSFETENDRSAVRARKKPNASSSPMTPMIVPNKPRS